MCTIWLWPLESCLRSFSTLHFEKWRNWKNWDWIREKLALGIEYSSVVTRTPNWFESNTVHKNRLMCLSSDFLHHCASSSGESWINWGSKYYWISNWLIDILRERLLYFNQLQQLQKMIELSNDQSESESFLYLRSIMIILHHPKVW